MVPPTGLVPEGVTDAMIPQVAGSDQAVPVGDTDWLLHTGGPLAAPAGAAIRDELTTTGRLVRGPSPHLFCEMILIVPDVAVVPKLIFTEVSVNLVIAAPEPE